VVIKQYPHILKVKRLSESVQDGSANWVSGPALPDIEYKCRLEPRSNSSVLALADGTTVNVQALVYMPNTVQIISPGTSVEIYDGDLQIAKGSVLQFNRGQLNARLWL
jgi:hypothetical protein